MKLLFPGTFDPFTKGHADLVERALALCDELVIAVGINGQKAPMYSVEERLNAISRHYRDNARVSVISYSGLTADAVRQTGATAILRGVRSGADFDMERTLADANLAVLGVETILLVATPALQHVSSSLCRELDHFGYDTDGLVIDTFRKKDSE
ncbi:MAG: pantetheine-phosphate adenylyltransferase [Bacteroidaceae bacterium]|nr:pantetheine-phosphate adenylyltransferase [Bacteroidaceae bacterium]